MSRKAPKEKSSQFNLGFKMKGMDGNTWKVVVTKNGTKRWQRTNSVSSSSSGKSSSSSSKEFNKTYEKYIKLLENNDDPVYYYPVIEVFDNSPKDFAKFIITSGILKDYRLINVKLVNDIILDWEYEGGKFIQKKTPDLFVKIGNNNVNLTRINQKDLKDLASRTNIYSAISQITSSLLSKKYFKVFKRFAINMNKINSDDFHDFMNDLDVPQFILDWLINDSEIIEIDFLHHFDDWRRADDVIGRMEKMRL